MSDGAMHATISAMGGGTFGYCAAALMVQADPSSLQSNVEPVVAGAFLGGAALAGLGMAIYGAIAEVENQ